MANVRIPIHFENKLRQGDQAFYGIVTRTIAEFGEILENNKLYFFEEYTDHGIKHIENVIASSFDLITNIDILTGKDIGAYMLSVLLHDIAMQIDLGGFVRIIEGEFDDVRVTEFDRHAWKAEWDEYLSEAKKFNTRQLKAIFGTEDIVVHSPQFSNPGSITNNDKKLIGEFIRRHHPRLAHEIALKGFPGGQNILPFADGIDQNLKNLIGLIARSHGMDLRKSIDYIEYSYGRKNKRHPLGIHAIYLMVLLRISDYIQIDSSRTSRTLVKLKTFSVPFSEAEHQSHLAISNVDTKYQDDPERIYVAAYPEDSNAYLKLQQLIKDIQYELDISWAVLGEHYGMAERPELKYRRIISNLEEETFTNRQTYVADSFSFRASDEIVNLMIAPLYGNNSSFGVRELLQNAVDACKEREEMERGNGSPGYKPLITLEVSEEKDQQFLTITDNGIGMNAYIIKNYFLTAGASFRKSSEWQKTFIGDDGKVGVRRSGRFGVGLLAAFLIGKGIYVETRKAEEEYGYRFEATLNTTQINITKDGAIPPGTRIRVSIDKEKWEEFEPFLNGHTIEDTPLWYEWYTLSYPVIRYIYKEQTLIPYRSTDPDLGEDLPIEWQAIDAEGFNKILWTYSANFSGIPLVCNGIVIPDKNNIVYTSLPTIETAPRISVFDNEGNLPISLDRGSLSGEYPFWKALLEDIYKDFLACALMLKEPSRVKDTNIDIRRMSFNYPGLFAIKENHHRLTPNLDDPLFSKKGYLINAQYCIETNGGANVLFIQSENFEPFTTALRMDIGDAFIQLSNRNVNSIDQYNTAITVTSNQLYDLSEWWEEPDGEEKEETNEESMKRIKDVHCNIYMKKDKYNFIFDPNKKRIDVWVIKEHKMQNDQPRWAHFKLGAPKYSSNLLTSSFLEEHADSINFIKEYQLTRTTNIRLLNNILKKYLGDDVIIPYEMADRRKKFPLAFKELDRYMKKYE